MTKGGEEDAKGGEEDTNGGEEEAEGGAAVLGEESRIRWAIEIKVLFG